MAEHEQLEHRYEPRTITHTRPPRITCATAESPTAVLPVCTHNAQDAPDLAVLDIVLLHHQHQTYTSPRTSSHVNPIRCHRHPIQRHERLPCRIPQVPKRRRNHRQHHGPPLPRPRKRPRTLVKIPARKRRRLSRRDRHLNPNGRKRHPRLTKPGPARSVTKQLSTLEIARSHSRSPRATTEATGTTTSSSAPGY